MYYCKTKKYQKNNLKNLVRRKNECYDYRRNQAKIEHKRSISTLRPEGKKRDVMLSVPCR